MGPIGRFFARILGYRERMTEEEYYEFVQECRDDAKRKVDAFCREKGQKSNYKSSLEYLRTLSEEEILANDDLGM